MRKHSLLIACMAVVTMLAVSCSKKGKTGLLIPRDAGFVVTLNLKSLSNKMTWEEVKSAQWFQMIETEADDSISKKLLADPTSSGIDVEGQHAIFMKTQGNGGYGALVAAIKDAAKFEDMVKKSSPDTKITTDGDLKIAEFDRESVAAWNSSTLVITFDASQMNSRPGMYGSGTKFTADSLLVFAKATFKLSGDQLLDAEPRFADLIKKDGDMHFWVNSEKYAGASMAQVVPMLNLTPLLKDNIGTGTLNFENGKISVKSNQYYGKELTDLTKKYPMKDVSDETINRLPAGKVLVAGAFNFPPAGLKEFLTLIKADGAANGALGQMGYSIDEFIKANKGEIAFAITDFSLTRTAPADPDAGFSIPKPKINFVAGVAVNDEAAFNKLIGIITTQTGGKPIADITHKLENKWFIVSNNGSTLDAFSKGGNKPEYADKIKGHASGAYVNIQELIRSVISTTPEGATGGRGKAVADISANFWQDAVMYADLKDGVLETTFEVNLADKSTNSLKALSKYADQIAALQKTTNDYERFDNVDSLQQVDSIRSVKPVK